MIAMAKKRSERSGGAHKTVRIPYQIPKPFSDLITRLAKEKQQPKVWYLLALILDAAKAAGVKEEDLPEPPWDA